jgi:hypothetical protein
MCAAAAAAVCYVSKKMTIISGKCHYAREQEQEQELFVNAIGTDYLYKDIYCDRNNFFLLLPLPLCDIALM